MVDDLCEYRVMETFHQYLGISYSFITVKSFSDHNLNMMFLKKDSLALMSQLKN